MDLRGHGEGVQAGGAAKRRAHGHLWDERSGIVDTLLDRQTPFLFCDTSEVLPSVEHLFS